MHASMHGRHAHAEERRLGTCCASLVQPAPLHAHMHAIHAALGMQLTILGGRLGVDDDVEACAQSAADKGRASSDEWPRAAAIVCYHHRGRMIPDPAPMKRWSWSEGDPALEQARCRRWGPPPCMPQRLSPILLQSLWYASIAGLMEGIRACIAARGCIALDEQPAFPIEGRRGH